MRRLRPSSQSRAALILKSSTTTLSLKRRNIPFLATFPRANSNFLDRFKFGSTTTRVLPALSISPISSQYAYSKLTPSAVCCLTKHIITPPRATRERRGGGEGRQGVPSKRDEGSFISKKFCSQTSQPLRFLARAQNLAPQTTTVLLPPPPLSKMRVAKVLAVGEEGSCLCFYWLWVCVALLKPENIVLNMASAKNSVMWRRPMTITRARHAPAT